MVLSDFHFKCFIGELVDVIRGDLVHIVKVAECIEEGLPGELIEEGLLGGPIGRDVIHVVIETFLIFHLLIMPGNNSSAT